MTRRSPTRWLAALALFATAQLGVSCDPLTPPPTPNNWLRVEVQNIYPSGVGYFLEASLFVETDQPVQAIDLSIDWQGDSLTVRPLLHADFDDDGAPFGPALPTGLSTGPVAIVDVRHGAPSPAGSVCVAQIWIYAPNGGDSTIDASGSIGRPDGGIAHLAEASVTHTP